MTNHVFRDVNRDELFAVMNGKRMAHKFRRNHRGPAPSLDNFLLSGLVKFVHLALQFVVDKRTFL